MMANKFTPHCMLRVKPILIFCSFYASLLENRISLVPFTPTSSRQWFTAQPKSPVMTRFLITVSGCIMKTKPGHFTYSPVQLPSWLKCPSGHWGRHWPSNRTWESRQAVQLWGLLPAHLKQDWWQAGRRMKQRRQSGKPPYDKHSSPVSSVNVPGLEHVLHFLFIFPRTYLTYFFLKARSRKASICGTQIKKA